MAIQDIEDMITDITISLEEGDKAYRTLDACQSSMSELLPKLRLRLEQLSETDSNAAAEYARTVSKLMLNSIIEQRRLSLKRLEDEANE
jgi:hypothetical protein